MMKQTLLKTIVLGLMAMVGVNAWADTVATIYDTDGNTKISDHETLAAAVGALSKDNCFIVLSADAEWTSRLAPAYSVTIKPASEANITISSNQNNQTAQVSTGNGKTVTFDGSDGENSKMTFNANGNVRSVFEGPNDKNNTFILKTWFLATRVMQMLMTKALSI